MVRPTPRELRDVLGASQEPVARPGDEPEMLHCRIHAVWRTDRTMGSLLDREGCSHTGLETYLRHARWFQDRSQAERWSLHNPPPGRLPSTGGLHSRRRGLPLAGMEPWRTRVSRFHFEQGCLLSGLTRTISKKEVVMKFRSALEALLFLARTRRAPVSPGRAALRERVQESRRMTLDERWGRYAALELALQRLLQPMLDEQEWRLLRRPSPLGSKEYEEKRLISKRREVVEALAEQGFLQDRGSRSAVPICERREDLCEGYKAIADFLGVSVSSIKRWASQDLSLKLKLHRLGGRIYAYKEELNQWREEQAERFREQSLVLHDA